MTKLKYKQQKLYSKSELDALKDDYLDRLIYADIKFYQLFKKLPVNPKQQADLRGHLTNLMLIAHGLGTTHTEDDLMQAVANLEKWIDHNINLEVSAAIKPYLKIDIKNRR